MSGCVGNILDIVTVKDRDLADLIACEKLSIKLSSEIDV